MPRSTYDSILHNQTPYELKQMQSQSNSWFREEVSRIKKNRYNKYQFIVRGREDTTKRLEIGKMYMFEYVPKHANELPVWDRYPLVIPFNTAPNGFIAINFHYLPYRIRAWLLDKLTQHANERTNKVRISWQILKGFSRANVGAYATHRYLINHITSPFRLVRLEDYPKAIMLPMAGWYGEDKSLVTKFRRMI